MSLPTRRRGNDQPSLLDLLFTNEAMQISDICHHAPIGKSDHDVISFNFHAYLDFTKPMERYVYDRADYEAMKKHLNDVRWKEEYLQSGQNKTIEELWNALKLKLMDLRNRFVPKPKISEKPKWKERGSVPINRSLQEAIRMKKITHRRWMSSYARTGEGDTYKAYAKARNKVKTLMRKAKRNFERDIAKNSKNKPKAFWSYVRSKLKTKAGVGPLLADVNDKSSTKFTDEEKANILQNQFSSVFTIEPEEELPPFSRRTNTNIYNVDVSEKRVRDEIINLNLNKSCGPDEVHPRLLFELVDFLSKPLAFLLQQTLQKGEIPNDWKKANVSPIYKKGARNKAENYRPISLTSIICKIMEKFIKEAVMHHLIDQELLSTKQFGFILGRSTILQLLKYLDTTVDKIASGEVVDTIYFAKAFDTVPHRRLLYKLEAYGIKGNLQRWISAFLRDRSQVVLVNGIASKSVPVLSGIPQGSVLGPLLFVIYINDLPENVNSDVYLFADDTKILRQVSSADDAINLQNDLDSLMRWSDDWLLKFNADKCHVLTLGKFENIKHTHRYEVYGEEIDHVFEETDLGVTIDFELTFEQHMSKKINKANATMGLIRRSFSFLDRTLFTKLYTTFVRPHLEYGQAVWSPYLSKHVKKIEKVQEHATKLVDGLNAVEYTDRLKTLNLPTLAYRRARGDMIEVYKHFHAYDKGVLSNSFKPRDRLSRQHAFQLIPNYSKDGIRGVQRNSFYHRAIDTWNNLPNNVVDAKNISAFKQALDNHWNDNPIKFCT